jgi:hypothetical protein
MSEENKKLEFQVDNGVVDANGDVLNIELVCDSEGKPLYVNVDKWLKGRTMPTSEHHKKEDYQYFLGLFADAVGYPGSPTMDEVLHRASEMKCFVNALASVYVSRDEKISQEARRVLGHK